MLLGETYKIKLFWEFAFPQSSWRQINPPQKADYR